MNECNVNFPHIGAFNITPSFRYDQTAVQGGI